MKKQIQFRLEENMIQNVQKLLTKHETITDFVREAIEKEIEYRQKKSQP